MASVDIVKTSRGAYWDPIVKATSDSGDWRNSQLENVIVVKDVVEFPNDAIPFFFVNRTSNAFNKTYPNIRI